jgi:SSS family solute:Na+ symporter
VNRPGSVDFAVIGLYALAVALLAWRASRRIRSPGEYFLASRGSNWAIVGLSMLASNISSVTLVGLAGSAYLTGISVFDYEWWAAVVLVGFTLFMLPAILTSGVYTVPEFLERRYSRGLRSWFALMTLFLNLAVDAAGTLYAGGALFQSLYPGLPLWTISFGLTIVAGAYAVAGGMRAVLHTEVLQAVVLLIGSALIATTAITGVGGWDALMHGVPASHLSLIRPLDDPTLPWLGMLTGVPILGFYFWCTNQLVVQRVLSARSIEHGRWGCLFAGLLKLPVLYLMVLPGTAALILYPGIRSSELVYPTLLFGLLPHGVLGIVLAGFLAAAMSSLAATFNAAATLFTMDFVHPRLPRLGPAALTRIGRIATLAFMAIAASWAPQIARFPSLWQYLQSVLAFAVPPIVAIVLAGLFWRRASATGAKAAAIVGLAGGAALFAAGPLTGAIDLHFLYVAPILLLLSGGTIVAVSLAHPASGSAHLPLMWTRATWQADSLALAARPWWQNYRLQGLGLLAITAAIVFSFR